MGSPVSVEGRDPELSPMSVDSLDPELRPPGSQQAAPWAWRALQQQLDSPVDLEGLGPQLGLASLHP